MNTKKMIGVIFLLMLLLCTVLLVPQVNAVENDWKNTGQFDDEKKIKSTAITSTTKKITSTIVNVIRVVGTGMAIVMLTYVAIKYMSAAPQEKAEFKKSATAYVVGAIVLFAASNILKVIADFATKNITT